MLVLHHSQGPASRPILLLPDPTPKGRLPRPPSTSFIGFTPLFYLMFMAGQGKNVCIFGHFNTLPPPQPPLLILPVSLPLGHQPATAHTHDKMPIHSPIPHRPATPQTPRPPSTTATPAPSAAAPTTPETFLSRPPHTATPTSTRRPAQEPPSLSHKQHFTATFNRSPAPAGSATPAPPFPLCIPFIPLALHVRRPPPSSRVTIPVHKASHLLSLNRRHHAPGSPAISRPPNHPAASSTSSPRKPHRLCSKQRPATSRKNPSIQAHGLSAPCTVLLPCTAANGIRTTKARKGIIIVTAVPAPGLRNAAQPDPSPHLSTRPWFFHFAHALGATGAAAAINVACHGRAAFVVRAVRRGPACPTLGFSPAGAPGAPRSVAAASCPTLATEANGAVVAACCRQCIRFEPSD